MNRKAFTRFAIADYWIQYERRNGKIPPWGDFDWGEPACMACGWWKPEWDYKKTISARWNAAQGLEKCHVIPLYLGGLDDPSNMVLMCGICHDSQPDSKDPEITYKYMKNRTLLDRIPGGVIAAGFIALEVGKSIPEATEIALEKFAK